MKGLFAVLTERTPAWGRAARRAEEALVAAESNRRIRERAVEESVSSTARLRAELRNLANALKGWTG